MQVKKQQLEPDMEQRTGSKLGKEVHQGCHPAYLTSMQSTSYEIPGWMNPKLKTARRNISNLIYAEGTTLVTESEELKV